jgi:hypothetical protein
MMFCSQKRDNVRFRVRLSARRGTAVPHARSTSPIGASKPYYFILEIEYSVLYWLSLQG